MSTQNFIGDIAKRVGMSVKTIRYYEGLGLLSPPERTEAGYRVYAEQDVERLRFIKGGKALGLSLADIKEVLAIWGGGDRPCHHVQALLSEKVDAITRRIEELSNFRDALRAYTSAAGAPAVDEDVPCRP